MAGVLAAWPARADADGDAAPSPRCGTPERVLRAVRAPRPPVSLAAAGGKITRDGFPGERQVLESTNFAAWWSDPQIDREQARAALDGLEEAWALYIDTLGHRVPPGAEQHRVNLYISTGFDIPSPQWSGAYADLDGEGYAYMVINGRFVADWLLQPQVRHMLAHEFHHDIQFGTGAFRTADALWYWEASAEWAAQALYPDSRLSYAHVGTYALATEYPVFFRGDPDHVSFLDVHHYGASIFLRHLSDRFDMPALVRDTWESAGAEDDPMTALEDMLPDGTIADAFHEFAPRMALWDFPGRDLILSQVDASAIAYGDRDRFAVRVGPDGTGGWIRVPDDRQLRAFGASIIQVARPAGGELRVAVDFDQVGTLGSTFQPRVTIVRETADGIRYSDLRRGRRGAAARIRIPEEESEAYVVVAATSERHSTDQAFPYRLSIQPGHAPDPLQPIDTAASEPTTDDGASDDGADDGANDGADDGGAGGGGGKGVRHHVGGCAAGGSRGGGPGAALGLVLVALAARRSRRSPR